MEKLAKLVKRYNKNTGKLEWALVSTKDPKKVLKWFGTKKPSKEEVLSEERRVQWFKSQGELKENVEKKEVPKVKDNYERSFVFGDLPETEFGSGLLKKDKELYPRYEFTENPQLHKKYSAFEVPPHIIDIMNNLEKLGKSIDKFENMKEDIKNILDDLKQIKPKEFGELSFTTILFLSKPTYKTIKDYLEKLNSCFVRIRKNMIILLDENLDIKKFKIAIEEILNSLNEINKKEFLNVIDNVKDLKNEASNIYDYYKNLGSDIREEFGEKLDLYYYKFDLHPYSFSRPYKEQLYELIDVENRNVNFILDKIDEVKNICKEIRDKSEDLYNYMLAIYKSFDNLDDIKTELENLNNILNILEINKYHSKLRTDFYAKLKKVFRLLKNILDIVKTEKLEKIEEQIGGETFEELESKELKSDDLNFKKIDFENLTYKNIFENFVIPKIQSANNLEDLKNKIVETYDFLSEFLKGLDKEILDNQFLNPLLKSFEIVDKLKDEEYLNVFYLDEFIGEIKSVYKNVNLLSVEFYKLLVKLKDRIEQNKIVTFDVLSKYIFESLKTDAIRNLKRAVLEINPFIKGI